MRGALGVALAKARLDPGPAHRVIPHRPRHRRPVPDRLRRSGDVPGRLGWTEPVRCAGRPLWTRPGCGGRLRDGAGAPPNAEPSRIPDVTRLRILFTFSGGTGHLNPLVPIARAAQAAGHVVAVTGQPSMVATIEATGLPAIPTGRISTSGTASPTGWRATGRYRFSSCAPGGGRTSLCVTSSTLKIWPPP